MAVIIDDAGSGDLLFGVVIGAFNDKNKDFRYDVVDVRYFQPPIFRQKLYLKQASKVVFSLLNRLKIQQMRMYVKGTNLWTKSNVNALDPEVGIYGYSYNTYPNPRTFVVGVNFTL